MPLMQETAFLIGLTLWVEVRMMRIVAPIASIFSLAAVSLWLDGLYKIAMLPGRKLGNKPHHYSAQAPVSATARLN